MKLRINKDSRYFGLHKAVFTHARIFITLSVVAIIACVLCSGVLIWYALDTFSVLSSKIIALFIVLILLSNMCSKIVKDIIYVL